MMFLLTYMRNDGYPVRLVFDSKVEAEYWGVNYSVENDGTVYTVERRINSLL